MWFWMSSTIPNRYSLKCHTSHFWHECESAFCYTLLIKEKTSWSQSHLYNNLSVSFCLSLFSCSIHINFSISINKRGTIPCIIDGFESNRHFFGCYGTFQITKKVISFAAGFNSIFIYWWILLTKSIHDTTEFSGFVLFSTYLIFFTE